MSNNVVIFVLLNCEPWHGEATPAHKTTQNNTEHAVWFKTSNEHIYCDAKPCRNAAAFQAAAAAAYGMLRNRGSIIGLESCWIDVDFQHELELPWTACAGLNGTDGAIAATANRLGHLIGRRKIQGSAALDFPKLGSLHTFVMLTLTQHIAAIFTGNKQTTRRFGIGASASKIEVHLL